MVVGASTMTDLEDGDPPPQPWMNLRMPLDDAPDPLTQTSRPEPGQAWDTHRCPAPGCVLMRLRAHSFVPHIDPCRSLSSEPAEIFRQGRPVLDRATVSAPSWRPSVTHEVVLGRESNE